MRVSPLTLLVLVGCTKHALLVEDEDPMPEAVEISEEEQQAGERMDRELSPTVANKTEFGAEVAADVAVASEPMADPKPTRRSQPKTKRPMMAGRGTASGAGAMQPVPSPEPISIPVEEDLDAAPRAKKMRPPSSGDFGGMVDSPTIDARIQRQQEREEYTDHGVNPFAMVADDALSTFSIDVDTASYTMSRRKLLAGQLPQAAGVRAEEYINYFNYGYTPPKDQPFAVDMEAMPDPFRPGHHILRVGVQGAEVAPHERPPVHLTFLVDVSGSMSSRDKLPLAKDSLHMLVDRLQERDTVSLCTYAGRVAKILDPTSAADKSTIHDAINGLNSGGSTAMSSGIDLAYSLADAGFQKGHENRVIVVSDGDANVGATSWDKMLSQIKGYADQGVTLTTVGFGQGNYRDTLMEQLANKGDGNNYYIDDRMQAQRVFVEQFGGTIVTIARDVKIQVEFDPDSVLSYRLIGYENRDIADRDFRNDRVDAGEIGSGHNVTALYDVILKDGYSRELATVRLRYEKPGADGTAMEKAFPFSARALVENGQQASKATRIAYTAGTFAEILRKSPHAAEISLDELSGYAHKARRANNADDRELMALIEAANLAMQPGLVSN